MFERWRARRATPPLYWWEPPRRSKHGFIRNFGDELNPWLFEQIKGFAPQRAKATHYGKTLAIGSILKIGCPGDIVWGSGLNGKLLDDQGNISLPPQPEKMDFRAVRGPLTRDLLLRAGADVPPIYGDPALLLSQFIPKRPNSERRGTLVLPHYSDFIATQLAMPDDPNIRLLRVDAPPLEIVEAINGSERVLTTALHGIIASEALQVPVTFFRMGSIEALFKYEDYFAGTGRSLTGPPMGLHSALDATPAPLWAAPPEHLVQLLESCPF